MNQSLILAKEFDVRVRYSPQEVWDCPNFQAYSDAGHYSATAPSKKQ
jgi:hypothetical protein